ncbi:PepSY domain-containing protein [Streptomyces sp. NPDC047014]|uniref:PepSY domain-containing protein n=1 Tax=Streptomyces sp. NPDC047014 TaxID=3155736 RepID=UPI0033DEE784
MQRTRTPYVSAAAAAVLALGGPVSAAAALTPADAARTATAAPAAPALRVDVTADAAAAAALKHYPGVIESLDRDGSVWHVDVISKDGKGHAELEVSASGAVTERDRDTDENAAENKALVSARTNAGKAMKAALAAHSGQVRSVQWDDGDNGGAPYWEVEISSSDGKSRTAHVDPATGKVTQSGSDTDDDSD